MFERKKRYIVMLCCLLLFAGACGREDNSQSLEATEKHDEDGNKEWESVGLSQTVKVEDKIIALTNGKKLDNLTVVGKDDPYYCNLEDNIRGGIFAREKRILMCKDPVYDITYFVNYGQDYFVYAMRDTVPELVLELPASELYCREGELYFMVEPYDRYVLDGIAQGAILKYNPADGTVEAIVNESTADIAVYPDGICYETHVYVETKENVNGIPVSQYEFRRFYYLFADGKTVEYETPNRQLDRWKNYWIVFEEEGGVSLQEVDGTETIRLDNLDYLPRMYWIKENFIYYLKNNTFLCYCMDTMEENVIVKLGSKLTCRDFIVWDNVVHFSQLLRISLADKRQYVPQIKDREPGPGWFPDAFYSDGEELYCINLNRFWRMTEEKVNDKGVQAEDVAGCPVEYNCYVYQLYPMGQ